MWWAWVIGVLVVWVVVGVLVALFLGRSIRMADSRSPGTGVLTTADLPASVRPAAAPVFARTPRRAVPLPPAGIALVAMALGLMTTGYVLRLTGATGEAARLLSMDAPYSLPRLFVAALFAAAALAAAAAAGRIPGRRTWWFAVALVAGGIAAVKTGSSVHADAMTQLADVLGTGTAVLVSVLLAGAVLAALAFVARAERRDRRRVLSTLALYAVASVGLSAVSAATSGRWFIAATFLEETSEALAGVAFLFAVLVGVAPRVVLPAAFALRRSADAHTLELPEALPGPTEGFARP